MHCVIPVIDVFEHVLGSAVVAFYTRSITHRRADSISANAGLQCLLHSQIKPKWTTSKRGCVEGKNFWLTLPCRRRCNAGVCGSTPTCLPLPTFPYWYINKLPDIEVGIYVTIQVQQLLLLVPQVTEKSLCNITATCCECDQRLGWHMERFTAKSKMGGFKGRVYWDLNLCWFVPSWLCVESPAHVNAEITAVKKGVMYYHALLPWVNPSLESHKFGLFYLENHRKHAIDANKQERARPWWKLSL